MNPLTIDADVEQAVAVLTWFYGALLEVDKASRQQLEKQLLMMLLVLPAVGEA
jgi:hypothetical protein